MTFKIEENIEVGLGSATFRFNVISDAEGVRLWLCDYRLKNGKKVLKRWSHVGDDGSFVTRDLVVIPEEVVAAARQKVMDSLSVA